jgi:hypothetical protein
MSQSMYSRAEEGDIRGMTVGSLERIVEAMGASLAIEIRFRGGLIDRLIDARHASLVEFVVSVLGRAGWLIEIEFGFNVYGDRGSVDILGWHAATRTLLIVEVKSRFTDLQAMFLSLARKVRLIPDVVRKELGWDPLVVSRLIAVDGTHGNRTILRQHASTFDATFPERSIAIRRWLRRPSGPIAGVWLISHDAVQCRASAR